MTVIDPPTKRPSESIWGSLIVAPSGLRNVIAGMKSYPEPELVISIPDTMPVSSSTVISAVACDPFLRSAGGVIKMTGGLYEV